MEANNRVFDFSGYAGIGTTPLSRLVELAKVRMNGGDYRLAGLVYTRTRHAIEGKVRGYTVHLVEAMEDDDVYGGGSWP